MAKEVVWSKRAFSGFERVIAYLEKEWTSKEVQSFVQATNRIVAYISEYPRMFKKTSKPDTHEALITPHNMLIYKIYPTKIVLLAFWDTRQNPKKKRKLFD